jgi:hypothetical protein
MRLVVIWSELLQKILVVLAAIALILVGPLLILWSLNTLFPALAIPYSIWTWLAAVVLSGAISAVKKA